MLNLWEGRGASYDLPRVRFSGRPMQSLGSKIADVQMAVCIFPEQAIPRLAWAECMISSSQLGHLLPDRLYGGVVSLKKQSGDFRKQRLISSDHQKSTPGRRGFDLLHGGGRKPGLFGLFRPDLRG